MASGLIGNEVPLTGLRVRVPCPPLFEEPAFAGFFISCSFFCFLSPCFLILIFFE